MSSIHAINIDRVNEAYTNGLQEARRCRVRASYARRIASALDGAYITKRIDEKLGQLFPEAVRAFYSNLHGYKSAVIDFSGPESYNPNNCLIYLCEKGEKRVNAEYLESTAKDLEEKADALETALSRFFEIVGQYNAIAAAYKNLRPTLSQFFDDLPYTW